MNKTGLEYLCTTIGNLAGIPVRMFEDGAQTERRKDENRRRPHPTGK